MEDPMNKWMIWGCPYFWVDTHILFLEVGVMTVKASRRCGRPVFFFKVLSVARILSPTLLGFLEDNKW